MIDVQSEVGGSEVLGRVEGFVGGECMWLNS